MHQQLIEYNKDEEYIAIVQKLNKGHVFFIWIISFKQMPDTKFFEHLSLVMEAISYFNYGK
jgi:hypothetical protein